jgi:hypothetical protein
MAKHVTPLNVGRVVVVVGLLGAVAAARAGAPIVALALCYTATLAISAALVKPRWDTLVAAGFLIGCGLLLAWPAPAAFVGSAAYFLLVPAERKDLAGGKTL